MLTRACAIAASLLALPPSAFARSQDETASAQAHSLVLAGDFRGCALSYEVLHRDHRHRQGQLTRASGSVAVMAGDTGIGVAVRLGLSAVEPAEAPVEAPTMAYLVFRQQTNTRDFLRPLGSDTPGHAGFLFRLGDSTADALFHVEGGGFSVAYTRGSGLTAQSFSVAVPQSEAIEFEDCVSQLLAHSRPATNLAAD